jgi:hypothetical protein
MMQHQNDGRIDELFEILERHRDTETHLIPHTVTMDEMRAERMRLIEERWIDLVAMYGNPLKLRWPIDRRGLPVAVDGMATLELADRTYAS